MEMYLNFTSYLHVFLSIIKGKQNNGPPAVLTTVLMGIRKFSGIPRCIVEWAVLQISAKHRNLLPKDTSSYSKTPELFSLRCEVGFDAQFR